MAVEVRRVIRALDRWSLQPAPQGARRGTSNRPSRILAGPDLDRAVNQLLDVHAPNNLEGHLETLGLLLHVAELTDGGRNVELQHAKPLLGRIETLGQDLAMRRPAGKRLYDKLFAPGRVPVALHLQHGITNLRRRLTLGTTVAAPAYAKALAAAHGAAAPGDLRALSTLNLARLQSEVGTVCEEEQPLFKRLAEGPAYFKHATDAARAIMADGRIDSPLAGQRHAGTTEMNAAFNHRAYVFGRFELQPGAIASRFGGSTIEVAYSHLDPDVSISLHDQAMPFLKSTQRMDHDNTTVRLIEGDARSKSWRQVYCDGASVVPVRFIDEVFYGREACREALALATLLELRRMAGVRTPNLTPASAAGSYAAGTALRHAALATASDDAALAVFMKQLFRIEIRVPMALDLNRLAYTVYRHAGSGDFTWDGQVDTPMRCASIIWRAQKKQLLGTAQLTKGFVTALATACEPHLRVVADTTASPTSLSVSHQVLSVWNDRLGETLQALQGSPQQAAIPADLRALAGRIANAAGATIMSEPIRIEPGRGPALPRTQWALGGPRAALEALVIPLGGPQQLRRFLLDKKTELLAVLNNAEPSERLELSRKALRSLQTKPTAAARPEGAALIEVAQQIAKLFEPPRRDASRGSDD